MDNELTRIFTDLKNIGEYSLLEHNTEKEPLKIAKNILIMFITALGYTRADMTFQYEETLYLRIYKEKRLAFVIIYAAEITNTIKIFFNNLDCDFIIITDLVEFCFFLRVYSLNELSEIPFLKLNTSIITINQLEKLVLFKKTRFNNDVIINAFPKLRMNKIMALLSNQDTLPF